MAAPAKLNLGLEVIGRRDDGFHEIATIFVAITLYDHLTLTPADELEITCDDDTLAGGDNLALRALQVLHQETHHRGGARIELSKRIPAAAGLGGHRVTPRPRWSGGATSGAAI
jgi:4-diphosphocytidyl-2-C-methyl-D-erythritol kinase